MTIIVLSLSKSYFMWLLSACKQREGERKGGVSHEQEELSAYITWQALKVARCVFQDHTTSEATDGLCFFLLLSCMTDH